MVFEELEEELNVAVKICLADNGLARRVWLDDRTNRCIRLAVLLRNLGFVFRQLSSFLRVPNVVVLFIG